MAEPDEAVREALAQPAGATRRLGERLAAGEIGTAAYRRELLALLEGAPPAR